MVWGRDGGRVRGYKLERNMKSTPGTRNVPHPLDGRWFNTWVYVRKNSLHLNYNISVLCVLCSTCYWGLGQATPRYPTVAYWLFRITNAGEVAGLGGALWLTSSLYMQEINLHVIGTLSAPKAWKTTLSWELKNAESKTPVQTSLGAPSLIYYPSPKLA